MKVFNMSRKQDDFVFLLQTRSCDTRSLARQSSICGFILCSDGIVWNPAISRNHVDKQRTQRISQFVGKTPMVATSITSRPDIRSQSCSTTFQRTTVADARALNAIISLEAQRSSETILTYPRGEINVSTAQLMTGDAFFDNMEGSKSQCGVIVFLTHEPRRFWHGELQLGHLVYWTSRTIRRVVRSTLAAEAYSVSEAVEDAQWLRSVLAAMWPSVPSSLPRSLRTVEMDSLRRPTVTLSDSFNLCQAVESDKGTGSDKRLRIVTVMLRQVFCGAQEATLAFVTTATMLADALTKALVHCPSLLAAMNARRYVFVTSDSSTGVKTTLPMPSGPVLTLKMAIGSQLIRSAESQVWSVHWLRRSVVTYDSSLSGYKRR